jgi:hypothetical protein
MDISKEEWQRVRGLCVSERPIKDISGQHPQSVLVKKKDKDFSKSWLNTSFSTQKLTQHNRVITQRAKKLNMSLEEYKALCLLHTNGL